MKPIFILLILQLIFLSYTKAFAGPPIVSFNVHVFQHASPSQCSGSWRGRVGPEDVSSYTRLGDVNDLSGPVVRSCTGCAVNSRSHDCVCRRCYDYFNGYE